MSVQKQSGKKNRKHGRGLKSPSRQRYRNSRRREHNKLKRVLKSNGMEKAVEYARKHNLHFNVEIANDSIRKRRGYKNLVKCEEESFTG